MSTSSKLDALLASVNVGNFVSVKPCLEGGKRDDFEMWRAQMWCLLRSQDMTSFVKGDVKRPRNRASEQYREWERRDSLVKGWILGSIGEDALAAVWREDTAREAWQALHRVFEKDYVEIPEDSYLYNVDDDDEDDEDHHHGRRVDYSRYAAVYMAAQAGDWDAAENFFDGDIDELCTTIITPDSETALHVAVLVGRATNDFVRRAVEKASKEALALKDSTGRTALHNAAVVGNTATARALVTKNPDLLHIESKIGRLAVHEAAKNCQRETLEFLIFKHEAEADRSRILFEGRSFTLLLEEIIASQNIDLALSLLHKYTKLTINMEIPTALPTLISVIYTLFRSRDTLTWWQNFIYHRIPGKKSEFEARAHTSLAPDVESLRNDGAARSSFESYNLEAMIWKVVEYVVPEVKEVKVKKAKHEQALQLAIYLCHEVSQLPETEALEIFKISIMEAAKYGVSEIVGIIIDKEPSVINHRDPIEGMNVFMMAAKYRFENVFNLIRNMSDRRYMLYDSTDNNGNNLMHICGKLAPPHRLNIAFGAARQMQREIQWFKEMEKFVDPSRRTWVNNEGKTPQMVFTEEHEELRGLGERWLKETCNACTIAATLIATVMFTAAIPGGLETTTGVPLFAGQTAFKIFVVSDTISLFFSIASLLEFLSIFISRYAEEDFLYLTKRLSLGMLTLFVSLMFMLVAFGATLYLVPYAKVRVSVFATVLGVTAFLPAMSLLRVQVPLLIEVVYSTVGPGIFGLISKRMLY